VNCNTFEDDKYFYWVCTTYGGAEYYSRINPGNYNGYDALTWWRDSTQYSIHDEDGSWPRSGWHYFVVTDDTSTVSLYIDGSLSKSGDSGPGSIGSFPLQIGSCEGNENNMDAILDEARLSNIVRNSDWILTEYNNQNNPSNFFSFGTEEMGSVPPGVPIINGPIAGKIKTSHTYTFVSIDPNGDNISYQIDWGDGNIEDWFGFYESNEIISRSHKWSSEGVFVIRARTKDVNDNIGDWGTLDVTMPKNKQFNFNFPLLSWLCERFPNVYYILRYIIKFDLL